MTVTVKLNQDILNDCTHLKNNFSALFKHFLIGSFHLGSIIPPVNLVFAKASDKELDKMQHEEEWWVW